MDPNTNLESKKAAPTVRTLSVPMKILCYISAGLIMGLMIIVFSEAIGKVINWILEFLEKDTEVSAVSIIAIAGILYLFLSLTFKLGNYWRSTDTEIGTSVTSFPNPFRDPSFKKGPIVLRIEYKKLYRQYRFIDRLLSDYKQKHHDAVNQLEKFFIRLKVLLRHHENASRLIESLTYSIKTNDYDLSKVLNDSLSECITVLEKDQSDKSISLFEVKDDRLIIRDGVRINAESVVKKTFQKGEGFAGYIWEKGVSEYLNEIDYENDPRFKPFYRPTDRKRYLSIMGIPLIVDGSTIGVLCIQSESTGGFSKDDLRTLEFYAHLCTMIMIYDNIKGEDGKEEGK